MHLKLAQERHSASTNTARRPAKPPRTILLLDYWPPDEPNPNAEAKVLTGEDLTDVGRSGTPTGILPGWKKCSADNSKPCPGPHGLDDNSTARTRPIRAVANTPCANQEANESKTRAIFCEKRGAAPDIRVGSGIGGSGTSGQAKMSSPYPTVHDAREATKFLPPSAATWAETGGVGASHKDDGATTISPSPLAIPADSGKGRTNTDGQPLISSKSFDMCDVDDTAAATTPSLAMSVNEGNEVGAADGRASPLNISRVTHDNGETAPVRKKEHHSACFGGASEVAMGDDGLQTRRADMLKIGDKVYSPSQGSGVLIVAITKSLTSHYCILNGLPITSTHPVHTREGWSTPAEIGTRMYAQPPMTVFNVVLQTGGDLRVNGWTVVTLGPSQTQDALPQHLKHLQKLM